MLFNAAQNMPPMMSLFPDTILKHYAYLRDTMPNFVPHLPVKNQQEMKLVGTTGSRQSLLQAAQENLERLASIDPELSGTAHFTQNYLGAELLMEQLQLNLMTHRNPSKESLNQLINKCLKLQNLFSNLKSEDLLLIKQICLRAAALNLVLVVKDKSQSAILPCQLLLHVAGDAQQFLQQNSKILEADSFTKSILGYLESVSDPKPGGVSRGILPIVQTSNYLPYPVSLNFNVSKFSQSPF
jgi:integrator complex subunit 4